MEIILTLSDKEARELCFSLDLAALLVGKELSPEEIGKIAYKILKLGINVYQEYLAELLEEDGVLNEGEAAAQGIFGSREVFPVC